MKRCQVARRFPERFCSNFGQRKGIVLHSGGQRRDAELDALQNRVENLESRIDALSDAVRDVLAARE
jgi:hypothetical protein